MSAVRRVGRWLLDALLLEVAVWRGLGRWLLRRPDVPPGTTPLGYAQLVTPTLLLWVFVSAVEVVVVDLVLPWAWLRLPLLVVGVWGVLWMLGLLGGYRTRPHLVDGAVLRLRGGLRVEVALPLERVATVTPKETGMPGSIRSLAVADDLLQVGVSGRTNLLLGLDGPTTLQTPTGPVTVTRVGVWVDEPRAVARLLRSLTSAPAR